MSTLFGNLNGVIAGIYQLVRAEFLANPLPIPVGDATTVTYTATGAGAVQRKVGDRLSDTVSIRDFGGVDDGVANNLAAFHGAIVRLNATGGGVLRLPKISTGEYFVNGDDALAVTAPIEIDADPGVSITMLHGGGVHMLKSANIRARREVKRYLKNFGFTSYYDAKKGLRLGETLPTVNNCDGVLSAPRALSGASFLVYRLANIVAAIAPLAAVADSITYDGGNVPTMAVTRAAPGATIHTLISSNTAGKFTAGVLTANGYAYCEMSVANGAIAFVEQGNGMAPILAGVNSHLLKSFRDYFNGGLVGVRVNSNRSFTVMVNGLALGTFVTRSNIMAAGFGTTDCTGNAALSQMFEVVGNGRAGSKPVRIAYCGDSISDDGVQYSHARYLQPILGTAGVQVENVINLAVAGETAAQQYARLQALGVGTGLDYCLIQVGVNDCQGQTPFADFTATIVGMVNYARSIGAVPIVAIPTGFYALAEAAAHGQNGGQDTANNASMATYRALLARAVAAAGGLLNMETVSGFGPVTPSLLDLAEYSANDRMFVDNIHPTPYASMMLAQGWARSILGHINQPDVSVSDVYEVMSAAWLAAGFGTTAAPTIRGRKLRGALSLNGAPEGATAMTMPAYVAPGVVTVTPVATVDAAGVPVGVCSMVVAATGAVKFYNVPATAKSAVLDGVTL